MIRVLNFFCVALAGLCCLALYHVSEQTRVARVELSNVTHQIQTEHDTMSVLEAEWERVADPSRVQQLAQEKLGIGDATSARLASLDLLPRRGDESAPLNNSPLRDASATVPAAPLNPNLHQVSMHAGL
ncbi:MAG TPA: hypothetical protein VK759_08970 [Rhizomicrobium sp.]|jgi:cell division protein FtsL|nr:hypothetical protein [Rhizomicrobium sp.]